MVYHINIVLYMLTGFFFKTNEAGGLPVGEKRSTTGNLILVIMPLILYLHSVVPLMDTS